MQDSEYLPPPDGCDSIGASVSISEWRKAGRRTEVVVKFRL